MSDDRTDIIAAILTVAVYRQEGPQHAKFILSTYEQILQELRAKAEQADE